MRAGSSLAVKGHRGGTVDIVLEDAALIPSPRNMHDVLLPVRYQRARVSGEWFWRGEASLDPLQ